MKTTKNFATKKLFACFLVFALSLSIFTANEGKTAAKTTDTITDTITVTLRIENSGKTLLPSTQITINPEDIEEVNQIYTVETGSVENGTLERIPLLPDHATAAHVIASYMIHTSQSPTEDLSFNTSYYDGSHNVAHIKGEKAPSDYAWSYRVNDAYPAEGSMDRYQIKNGDNIVLFYSELYDPSVGYGLYTNYSFFDQNSYETTVGNDMTVTLKKEDGYDENYETLIARAAGETISVSLGGSVIKTVTTDENGTASLSFDQAGTYTITSERYTEEGLCVNSRAYATVTVSEVAPGTPVPDSPTQTAPVLPTATPAGSLQATPSPAPQTINSTVKKTDAPKKIKLSVKKKQMTLSWKKVKDAKGYVISLSKKDKKNFKRFASTKKTSITKKLKKGNYYIKIRSYKTVDGKKVYSKYSKIISLKIK